MYGTCQGNSCSSIPSFGGRDATFVDGWRDTVARFLLHATPDRGVDLPAGLIAILPSGVGTTTGSAGALPYNDASFLLSGRTEHTEVTVPTSGKAMYIELAAGPRLLLTRAPLTWTVTSA